MPDDTDDSIHDFDSCPDEECQICLAEYERLLTEARDALLAAEDASLAVDLNRFNRRGVTAALPAPIRGRRTPMTVQPARIPRQARPVPSEPAPTPAITASGVLRGNDLDEAARTAWRRAKAGGDGRYVVASVQREYPEAQRLGQSEDPDRLRALVAAGGICGPIDARYDVVSDASAKRPIRDALPGFQATRGGLVFQKGASINDVDPTAVGTMTAAQDAAGATTKTIWCIGCSPSETVTVDAVYTRLCFSNFSDRYNPEHAQAWINASAALHARVAEGQLLASIDAQSLAVDASPVPLGGGVRDFADVIARLVANVRSRERYLDTQTFRVIAPDWLGAALASDRQLQEPGDDALPTTVAEIESILGNNGVSVIWSPDADVMPDQVAGALNGWPTTTKLRVFASDDFLSLDGGTLDLGFVRDSATNAKNRFETFVEDFGAVAKIDSVPSFTVTVPICVSGHSSAPATFVCT